MHFGPLPPTRINWFAVFLTCAKAYEAFGKRLQEMNLAEVEELRFQSHIQNHELGGNTDVGLCLMQGLIMKIEYHGEGRNRHKLPNQSKIVDEAVKAISEAWKDKKREDLLWELY